MPPASSVSCSRGHSEPGKGHPAAASSRLTPLAFSKGWEGKFSCPKWDSPFLPVLVPAKATNRLLETDDPASLCEGLSARSDASQQLQTSIQIAEVRSALKLA